MIWVCGCEKRVGGQSGHWLFFLRHSTISWGARPWMEEQLRVWWSNEQCLLISRKIDRISVFRPLDNMVYCLGGRIPNLGQA